MPYTFKLHIEKEKSKLVLLDDNKEVASKEWSESRDMGKRLFQSINELLVEQGLQPEDVTAFEIDSDMPDGYTSMRIAETVKKVYTFGVEQKIDKQG
jgi:tRNA A37 threonylcarbamoyladenosine modification protein TsaB